jgi:flagellar assembly protein FliH
LKKLPHGLAELYHFPSQEDLARADALLAKKEAEAARARDAKDAEPEPEPDANPISFAQIQADAILKEAREKAEEILQQARQEAEEEAKAVCAAAQENGYREGYLAGAAKAEEEARKQREAQAKALEEEVQRFLDQVTEKVERSMDAQADDLRDLAIAVAEKVVCISLKSSSEVIGRMIQTAIDKRKHREWVRIYISECDAKRMAEIPQSLSASHSEM